MQIKIDNIKGISLSPLKIISGETGSVMHGMKKSDSSFFGFGEAYFSTISKNAVKGWKRHNQMVLNLTVPVGEIEFTVFDDTSNSVSFGNWGRINLSPENYYRLTVQPGLWLAFRGISENTNMLLNLASIEHDPSEAENRTLNHPEMPDIWGEK